MKHHRLFLYLIAGLLILTGCATPPPPARTNSTVQEEEPDLQIGNLIYARDGFVDTRTGWIYPQTLNGGRFSASQAWDRNDAVIGIIYTPGLPGPEIDMRPVPVPESLVEEGTVTVLTYPSGFLVTERTSIPDSGNMPKILGLGHGRKDSEEEFWAYQKTLEDNKYNLWKMARLADADAPGRIFQSLLVLKGLPAAKKTDALVVTIGKVNGIYTMVVVRKYVRTKEDVEKFGDWAYGILREMGLTAVKE